MNELQRPAMIFHVAFQLSREPRKASELRPMRMRRAFEDLGYEVLEISGRHAKRRDRIKEVRRRIEDGQQIDFVYSEAATAPTGIGEPVTAATSLTRDINFLSFCQKRGIPVGLFYRDIYWCFPIYDESVKRPLSTVLRALFRWDLRRYRRAGFRIYLPSLKMAEHLPIVDRERVRALPPGGDSHEVANIAPAPVLRLLYVGGLGSNYRLHRSIAEIAGRDDAELTLCVPEAQWADRREEYNDLLAPNIRVVHRSGDDLPALYEQADACLLAAEPIDYWSFAAPVKLFEYISYGKPIFASNHSYPGEFVIQSDLGWSVDYGSGQLGDLIGRLAGERAEFDRVAQHVRSVRSQHTWAARATEVAQDLS